MKRRAITVAMLLGIAGCNAKTPAKSADCYRLAMSSYTPDVGADTLYFTPPVEVRLVEGTNNDRVIEPLVAVDAADPVAANGTWQSPTRDSLSLIWTDGTTGVRINARVTGDSLHGTARPISDIVVPEHMQPRATVTGVRFTCPSWEKRDVQ